MAGTETLVGSLQEVGAAELLRMLALSHHTGLLRVGSSAPHWAAIAGGDLVVAGSASGPTIIQALVANGVLTQDDANTLTANAMQSRAHDLNVLPILVERLGAVKLYPTVRDQTVSAVFQMLLPSQDEFTFVPGERLPIADHFQFPTEIILTEATRRVEEWAEIARSISSTQSVFRIRRTLNPELPSVTLTPEEWAVLAVLDGRRSVAQTIAALGRSAYDVCSVIHRLLKTGLVERLD
jgi:hypothetical protein